MDYSQFGEQAIIASVLARIGTATDTPFAVEFGAADGWFCSNTAALWSTGEWDALLIEADHHLFARLCEVETDRVRVLQARIENLDDFTQRVADVCSIDVDGEEHAIWSRLETAHRVMVVEHNPTAPPHVHMIGGDGVGSSALALVELGQKKGYALVAATTANLIFVRRALVALVPEVELADVFDRSCLNYVVTDYGGHWDTVGRWPYGQDEPRDLGLVCSP